jgi:hypothetical protein
VCGCRQEWDGVVVDEVLTRWPRIAEALGLEDACCEKMEWTVEREESEFKAPDTAQDDEICEPSKVDKMDNPETDTRLSSLASAPDVQS